MTSTIIPLYSQEFFKDSNNRSEVVEKYLDEMDRHNMPSREPVRKKGKGSRSKAHGHHKTPKQGSQEGTCKRRKPVFAKNNKIAILRQENNEIRSFLKNLKKRCCDEEIVDSVASFIKQEPSKMKQVLKISKDIFHFGIYQDILSKITHFNLGE